MQIFQSLFFIKDGLCFGRLADWSHAMDLTGLVRWFLVVVCPVSSIGLPRNDFNYHGGGSCFEMSF